MPRDVPMSFGIESAIPKKLESAPIEEIQESGITFPRTMCERFALVTRIVASVPRSFSPATDSSVTLMAEENIMITTIKGKSPLIMLTAKSVGAEKSYPLK